MTSGGRWLKTIKSGISQQPLIGSFSNLKPKLCGINQNWELLVSKTTHNGRRAQTQHPSSTFELKPRGPDTNWKLMYMKMASKYKKLNISATTVWIFLNFETQA